MTDYNNIKLQEQTKAVEKMVDISQRGNNSFQKVVFEFVALALIIALFLFENGELIIKEQPLIILLGNIAVMFLLSMLFDNNYRLKGKMVGMKSEKYRHAVSKLQDVTLNLKDEDIKNLNVNIEDYLNETYQSEVAEKLYRVGIALEDYDNIYKFADVGTLRSLKLSRLQIKGIKSAKKVKKSRISLENLMNEVSFGNKKLDFGKNQKRLDIEHNAKSMGMYLLSATIFTYFAVGLSEDLTLASVGWYLIKVCFLGFRGVKSYFESYIEIAENGGERILSQANYIVFFSAKNNVETIVEGE